MLRTLPKSEKVRRSREAPPACPQYRRYVSSIESIAQISHPLRKYGFKYCDAAELPLISPVAGL